MRFRRSSWVGVWGGLELNILSVIPLVCHFSRFQAIEGCVKYFLVQSFGRVVLLFSGLIYDCGFSFFFSTFCFFLLFFRLFLKIGVFPLHWWFPGVIAGLGWFGVFLVRTWQKVAPLLVFLSLSGGVFSIVFLGAISSLIGGLGGICQSSSRGILAYSGIGHFG